MNAIIKEAPEQAEIEALLPWHAAGTLSRRDAERVEKALANDNELAHRFELVREELGETILLNESLGAPSARAMQKLFAAIDAEPVRKPAVGFNLGRRITEFFAGFSPRTLAYASGAAVFAILLQAGLLAGIALKETQAPTAGSYQTVSLPHQGQPELFVQFVPTATAAEITEFLKSHQASLVEGPRAGGMYRLRLAVTGMPKEELARLIREIEQSKLVGFSAQVE